MGGGVGLEEIVRIRPFVSSSPHIHRPSPRFCRQHQALYLVTRVGEQKSKTVQFTQLIKTFRVRATEKMEGKVGESSELEASSAAQPLPVVPPPVPPSLYEEDPTAYYAAERRRTEAVRAYEEAVIVAACAATPQFKWGAKKEEFLGPAKCTQCYHDCKKGCDCGEDFTKCHDCGVVCCGNCSCHSSRGTCKCKDSNFGQ
jgi:hypothetical protein